MSAREIIAPIIYQKLLGLPMDQEPVHEVWKSGSFDLSDAILAALAAAGYRILAPGELDPVTIERCAAVAEARVVGGYMHGAPEYVNGPFIAAAIRSLNGGRDDA